MDVCTSYFELATRAYAGLDKLFKVAEEMEWYNLFAPECEQIIEKLLKALLEVSVKEPVPELMRTHNLLKIGKYLNTIYTDLIDLKTVAWIGSFYFNARYPGDDFIYVTHADATALKTATTVIADKLISTLHSVQSSEASTNPTSYFEVNDDTSC